MKFQHVYSPEQFQRAAEAWSAILAVDGVSVSLDRGGPTGSITPATVWELIWSDGAETAGLCSHTVALFSWSDYGGTGADVANTRYLTGEGSPFHGWVVLSADGVHGAGSAWVQLGELPGHDIDSGLARLEQLAAVMGATETDSPLCPQTHDDYLAELAAAAWDQWLRLDIPRQITALIDTHDIAIPRVLLDHGYPVEDASEYAGWLWEDRERRFAEAYYACPDNHWACQPGSATTVVNHGHDQAVRHAAQTTFGWTLDPHSRPAATGSHRRDSR